MTTPIIIVQGGQYGSESKGAISAHICATEGVDVAVRTGATNAGHTVYHEGKRYVMQQLPTGWVNPDTRLVIGAGAIIDPAALRREITMIEEATGEDPRSRILVDPRAYIHRDVHGERSAESDRSHKIGATGKGCSEAIIDRLRLRGVKNWTVGETGLLEDLGVDMTDTESWINRHFDQGAKILLEGTQGQLLDLCLGPYPFVTHKQTGPAQWMLEAGLSPSLPTDIVMVVRAYPIRVAGNSGPLPGEMSWCDLARSINRKRGEIGQEPLISPWAIKEFEDRLETWGPHAPEGHSILAQHTWPDRAGPEDRWADVLLNANTDALNCIAPEARDELMKLFETTTVTQRLRRVARLDSSALRVAARQVRPSRVALTFFNYEFPDHWFVGAPPLTRQEWNYIQDVGRMCDAPVTMINRGPLPEHIAATQ